MNHGIAHRRVLAILVTLMAASVCIAHPGAGIVVTEDGTIYCAYGPGHHIWRVTADGKAEAIITGGFDQPFRVPHHLVLDDEGRLYTASDAGSYVWRIDVEGDDAAVPHRVYPHDDWDGEATVGLGGDPFTIAPDGRIVGVSSGDDRSHSRIVRIARDGSSELLAGGERGFRDGRGAEARFGRLHGSAFAWGPNDDLYLTDSGRAVRVISSDGAVWTLAGGPHRAGEEGADNPTPFEYLMGLTVADDGTVYAADWRGNRIHRIAADGTVTTLAGTGKRGHHDGPAAEAEFNGPAGVALDASGNLCVLEVARVESGEVLRIRRIDTDGNVTTVATIDEP
jgi:sugar lactone lactonase YvrE